MKHLRGSLISRTIVEEVQNDSIRYVDMPYGKIKLVRSSLKCAVCRAHMWYEDKGTSTVLREGFKVMDSRAYVGGLPDYLKASSALLECHDTCKVELQKILDEGLPLPVFF